VQPPQSAPEPKPGKLNRWLSRAEKQEEPKSEGTSSVLGDTSIGGLSACCHLIKLLEPEELMKVKDILVAAMRDKGLDGELVEAPKLAAPVIPAKANEASKKLAEVMAQVTELANDAAARELAAIKAINRAREEAKAFAAKQNSSNHDSQGGGGGGGGGEGGGKLDRWVKRAEQKSAESKAEEPAQNGKLSRWLKRAEKKADPEPEKPKEPEEHVDESSTDALDVTKRCCKRVRAAWEATDKAGGGSAFLKEKAQLAEEKRALENLMQMVYAAHHTNSKYIHTSYTCMYVCMYMYVCNTPE